MTAELLCSGSDSGRHSYRYGGSSTPIENCERPRRLVCLDCEDVIVTRCSASSRAKCPPCGETYRRRVGRIFASGRTDLVTDRLFFLTLTAPSEHGRHRIGKNGPWCECTPQGGIHLGEWNATCGQRWSHFIEDLRRTFGRDLQFCKSAEAQERGAIHFHALLRLNDDLVRALPEIRALAIKHGFGHEIDLRSAKPGDEWYCAKYASKAADDRADVPWLDQLTGEVIVGNPRLRVWTSSRYWGLTMAALRRLQAAWHRNEQASTGRPEGGAPAPPPATPSGPTEVKPSQAGPAAEDAT